MQLSAIPPHRVEEFWPIIAPYAAMIEKQFPDDWPVPVIAQAAVSRDLTLWLIFDEETKQVFGCVATRVLIKPSHKRTLDIAWTAGSERDRWLHLLPIIEQHAREEHCSSISFTGRHGWNRELPGYRCQKQAVYEKELNLGQQFGQFERTEERLQDHRQDHDRAVGTVTAAA